MRSRAHSRALVAVLLRSALVGCVATVVDELESMAFSDADATANALPFSAAAAGPTAYGPGPCDGQQFRGASWCDTSKPFKQRAAALVATLSVNEKAGLFSNDAAAVPRLEIPRYNWWNEALHGVARSGVATSFPQVIGLAASFNKSLFHLVGDVTSTEARGKNNNRSVPWWNHGLTLWTPNINVYRDPRWGRGHETPGEDPTVAREYATAYVRGLQGEHQVYLKTAACLKHLGTYSAETGRMSFAAVVSAQDMEDTYLPAFASGVEDGRAAGLMCSYSAETFGRGSRGPGSPKQGGAVPSCANQGLLSDLARGRWGFDGYITSDCGGTAGVAGSHGYTSGVEETVAAVMGAGMDLDCGSYMNQERMAPLLGRPDVARLGDAALVRLFHVQMRLGFFDARENVPWGSYGPEVVDTAAHRRLAREAADQSLVLLKNGPAADGGPTLPLRFGASRAARQVGRAPRVAVVGRNALASTNMQGSYFGVAPLLISPCAGVNATVAAAGGSVFCDDGADGGRAVRAWIRDGLASAVVLVAGLTSKGAPKDDQDEIEGKDRSSLLLPRGQDGYIAAVAADAAAAGVPVALVLMSGGPVDLSSAKADPHVGAILWCGYPGQAGGAAIADALFGVTSPSGRLTMTWHSEDFTRRVSMADMRMRPGEGTPGRSHRFFTGVPVFHFGEGLSYANVTAAPPVVRFEAGALSAIRDEAARLVTRSRSCLIGSATVALRNHGPTATSHSVLLFAAPPLSVEARLAAGAPKHLLLDFDRVRLEAGEAAEVLLPIRAHDLTFADAGGWRVTAPGVWRFWTGAADGGHGPGMAEATLSNAAVVPPRMPPPRVPSPSDPPQMPPGAPPASPPPSPHPAALPLPVLLLVDVAAFCCLVATLAWARARLGGAAAGRRGYLRAADGWLPRQTGLRMGRLRGGRMANSPSRGPGAAREAADSGKTPAALAELDLD